MDKIIGSVGDYWEGRDVPLEGAVLDAVRIDGDVVYLDTNRGVFMFHHVQDCCESVILADEPDLTNFVPGEVIVCAETRTEDLEVGYGIGKATFYNIVTHSNFVDMRWYGESNGYYGVGVDVSVLGGGAAE